MPSDATDAFWTRCSALLPRPARLSLAARLALDDLDCRRAPSKPSLRLRLRLRAKEDVLLARDEDTRFVTLDPRDPRPAALTFFGRWTSDLLPATSHYPVFWLIWKGAIWLHFFWMVPKLPALTCLYLLATFVGGIGG
ncbi:hypothetical protein B0H14DRAFT_3525520 [Mycena olivaceomarginata]|nr:hypothetical protein B0H14DRAFT_3525520 [Mycena olivaceomarginata]